MTLRTLKLRTLTLCTALLAGTLSAPCCRRPLHPEQEARIRSSFARPWSPTPRS